MRRLFNTEEAVECQGGWLYNTEEALSLNAANYVVAAHISWLCLRGCLLEMGGLMRGWVYKVYYQMGNKQSKSYKPPCFKREHWQSVASPRRNLRPQHGLFQLFRNNLTNQEVEQYQIYFHNHAGYQKYLQFFEWREREDNIVNTKFMNTEQTKQFCNSHHSAAVYLEHVPVRLSDIQDIPYPQNLYVLFSALDGFEKLFHFVGYFRPEEDFVCIDHDGRVKVWINSDLSKCHTAGSYFSDEASNFHDSHQYQQQMVAQIIDLVQNNTADQIEASTTFRQHLEKNGKQKLSFKQAKQEIINYAKANFTQIPNYFESVVNVFLQDKASEIEEASFMKQQLALQEEKRILNQNRQSTMKNMINARGNTLVSAHVERSRILAEDTQQHTVLNGPIPNHTINKTFSFDNVNHPNSLRPFSEALSPPLTENNHFKPQSTVQTVAHPRPIIQNAYHPYPSVKFNYTGFSLPLNSNPITTPFTTIRPKNHSRIYNALQIQVNSTNQPTSEVPPLRHLSAFGNKNMSSQRLPINSTVQELKNNNKLLYSDTTQTYELDQQIVKDIIKYFG